MVTHPIEKQFQMWIHFLWMILGVSVGFSNLISILLAGSALFLGLAYISLLKRSVLPRDEIFS